jgi:hypothetical protein
MPLHPGTMQPPPVWHLSLQSSKHSQLRATSMWLVSISDTASDSGTGEGAARARVAKRRVRAGVKCILRSDRLLGRLEEVEYDFKDEDERVMGWMLGGGRRVVYIDFSWATKSLLGLGAVAELDMLSHRPVFPPLVCPSIMQFCPGVSSANIPVNTPAQSQTERAGTAYPHAIDKPALAFLPHHCSVQHMHGQREARFQLTFRPSPSCDIHSRILAVVRLPPLQRLGQRPVPLSQVHYMRYTRLKHARWGGRTAPVLSMSQVIHRLVSPGTCSTFICRLEPFPRETSVN